MLALISRKSSWNSMWQKCIAAQDTSLVCSSLCSRLAGASRAWCPRLLGALWPALPPGTPPAPHPHPVAGPRLRSHRPDCFPRWPRYLLQHSLQVLFKRPLRDELFPERLSNLYPILSSLPPLPVLIFSRTHAHGLHYGPQPPATGVNSSREGSLSASSGPGTGLGISSEIW